MGEDAKSDSSEYAFPKEFEEEAQKLFDKIESLNLPKVPGKEYEDVCKITDAAFKKTVLDFIAKVNTKGDIIPKPNC